MDITAQTAQGENKDRTYLPTHPSFNGHARDQRYQDDLKSYLSDPQILIEISSRCNFACNYCTSPMNYRQKTMMSMSTIFKVAPQLPSMTTRPVALHIDGEPLMHPNFIDIATLVNRYGLHVNLATNGSLLKPTYAMLMLDMTMLISLSTSAQELKNRHPKLDFIEYIRNVARYVRAWAESDSPQHLMIQVMHMYPETHLNFEEYGQQKIREIKNFLSACSCEEHIEGDLEWCGQAMFLRKKNGKGSLRFIKQFLAGGGLYPIEGKLVQYEKPEYGFCDSAWKRFTIQADGAPGYCCVDLSGQTSFAPAGTVEGESLAEIWKNHPNLQAIREGWLAGKVPCDACERCLAPSAKREYYMMPDKFPITYTERG